MEVMHIQKGNVKLSIVNPFGKEAVVAVRGPGDFFGEACMVGQLARRETAAALIVLLSLRPFPCRTKPLQTRPARSSLGAHSTLLPISGSTGGFAPMLQSRHEENYCCCAACDGDCRSGIRRQKASSSPPPPPAQDRVTRRPAPSLHVGRSRRLPHLPPTSNLKFHRIVIGSCHDRSGRTSLPSRPL